VSLSREEMNEAEIRNHFIDPALDSSGWDLNHRRLEYTLTAGRIVNRDGAWNRGEGSAADYILMPRPDLHIGVIEAKDGHYGPDEGLQQALDYAGLLDLPFAASSNGEAFVFHDKTGLLFDGQIERMLPMDQFPDIETLLNAFYAWRGWSDDDVPILTSPHYQDPAGEDKEPRYYQRIAIQAALEDIHSGNKRGLLAMATGSGKTYVASQIIHRIKSAGLGDRVLFIADRDNLINQTLSGDFAVFGNVATRIVNRDINPAYEVYTCLYQSVTSSEEDLNVYREFSPDFFDIVIVDECHRGSAKEDSAWREILNYFDGAYHLGLTATPKEDKFVSTQTYFGEPLYQYSLGQGIDDGFLAPYIVHRIDLDVDVDGFSPGEGVVDQLGQDVENRIYNRRDMEREMVLEERTELVACNIVDYLEREGVYSKTIVFCVDTDHAARVRRAIINELARRELPDIQHPLERMVMRITGNDPEGKASLDFFQNPREPVPVVATTSKLLNTGTDVPTCKLIVIDQEIRSQGIFRQTIGRGTRISERYGKLGFTIMDFRGSTLHFLDPSWDGVPEIVIDGSQPQSTPRPRQTEPQPRQKYYLSGHPVNIVRDQVTHLDSEGQEVTVSLRDFALNAALEVCGRSFDEFLQAWNQGDREEIIVALWESAFPFDEICDELDIEDASLFDVVCHVAYDRPPLTRRERADSVKKRDVYTRYGYDARAVLDMLLDLFAKTGEVPSRGSIAQLQNVGTPAELVDIFGGRDLLLEAIDEISSSIYSE
jgi:type I restriction enzyme, R subunit